MTHHRDAAIKALSEASNSLDIARAYVRDPILLARIREVAHEVLTLIGKLAVDHNEEVVS